MANDLMIPEAAEVPAYILNPELAKLANEEAAAGISTGAPPRIKLAGKQFTLVDGSGNEIPVKPGDMFAGPDKNLYMPVIVLRAKKEIQKAWYAKKFNPNDENREAPDCFSNDGVRPDASCRAIQCDSCANCPMNAFGSGKDQNGNPTAGKACSDNKILAVFVPKAGVHKFKLPPASLKNWGIYVKNLTARGIPVGNVKTLLGFDLAATFPVVTFQFGGFVPENLIPKLAEMAQSLEAEEIVNEKIINSTHAPAAAPAPVQKPAAAAKPKAVEKKPEPVVVADDLGLGLDIEVEEEVQQSASTPSDDELAAELGL